MFRSTIQTINDRLYTTILHKISTLFAILYVIIYSTEMPYDDALFYLLLSIIISLGIAGMGFIINDYSDIKKDRAAGKTNMFVQLNQWQIGIISFVCLCFSIIPWFYLYFDKVAAILLCSEFLLFFVYSFRPFRLKEKGIAGVVIDALYAHVLPCLLASYIFLHIGKKIPVNAWAILIFAFWLLLMGTRNILFHQVEDLENDKRSHTRTLATIYGSETIQKILLHYIAPFEFIVFLTILYLLPGLPFHTIILVYLIYCAAYMYKRKQHNYHKYYISKEHKISPGIVKFYNGNLLNEFYEIYLPIIILVIFSILDRDFILILFFHLIVFYKLYITNILRLK